MVETRIRRGFVDGPAGQIHYREAVGPDDYAGSPLVLLHVNSATSTMYLPALACLGPQMRTIAMDYPGYGDSDPPVEPYTEMSQWSASVVGLLDGLGIGKAHLAGHQTGAQVAADVAARYSEKVDRLVLSDIFNWNTPDRRAAHEALHRAIPASEEFPELSAIWQGARNLSQLEGQPTNWETWGYQFVASVRLKLRTFANPEPVRRAYGEMGWDGAVPYAMCRQDIRATLAQVRAPTLIMHSERGRFIRAHDSLVEATPGAVGYVIPGGGASTATADPVTWSRPIIEFLLNPNPGG